MGKNKQPTYEQTIRQVLSETDGYIKIDDLVAKVLEMRQSSSKKPSTQIRHVLGMDLEGSLIAFLDKDTIVCLNTAMIGVKFRIPISKFYAKNHIFPSEFLDGFDTRTDLNLIDFFDDQENKLEIEFKQVKRESKKQDNVFNIFDFEDTYMGFGNWDGMKKAKEGDSIIVTIKSWEPRQFSLKLDSKKEYQAHKDAIKKKNTELVDILFRMLENSGSEYLLIGSAILTAYIRMSDPKGYPGDHWSEVIENDGRMSTGFHDIRYSDDSNKGLFNLFFGDEKPKPKKKSVSPSNVDQVYVFKANFKYREGVWRRIEIKGEQTLADFDGILRDAFNHDLSDHLSGFWKLIRRGNTNRFREADIGELDPYGDGEGSDTKIAELELKVGDRIKYVYDFGDWIEHEITLETINPKAEKLDYPRIIEQNKPKYKYCVDCEAKGKKTIAKYVCIECSNNEGERVLICEKCADKNHEDHYYEEYTY